MLALSFTSCDGGSDEKREKSSSLTLSFVGITDPVIVKNICQDKNKDGLCGAKEQLSKTNLKKGLLIENGKYSLENLTPNIPLLVEIYDPQNIKYDGGSLTLKFNVFKIEERNLIKEISAIQLLEDWGYLTVQETKKIKETENRELLDRVIFESFENNYNLLRNESLTAQVATNKGLEALANKLKKVDVSEELPNEILFCIDNSTCIQNLLISISQELTITKKEAGVIAQKVKGMDVSNDLNSIVVVPPTSTPVPTVVPTSTPIPTVVPILTPIPTVIPTSTLVPTVIPTSTLVPTVIPTSTPVPTVVPILIPIPTVIPTSTPVPTVVPISTPVPTVVSISTPVPTVVSISTPLPTVVPISTPVPTVAPKLKEIVKFKSTLKKTGQIISYQKFDDGDYQIGVTPNYSRSEEIVTDNITGLQWQDDKEARVVQKRWITTDNYKKKNYNDTSGDTAITYCDKLTLGGYTNWRLPTRKELLGIIDYGKFNPAIGSVFVNVSSRKYWSSTEIGDDGSNRWIVSFLNGAMLDADGETDNDKNNNNSESYYIRCIRGK